MMKSIAFIDTEIDPKTGKILDMGGIRDDGTTFHQNALETLVNFTQGVDFICGHNIINHDLHYLTSKLASQGATFDRVIDTLHLSPLLFPTSPYHALLKDDKLQTDELNNPLNDSLKARDLFYDEVSAFAKLDEPMKQILFHLLHDQPEFQFFFRFIDYASYPAELSEIIDKHFDGEICDNANLSALIEHKPVELAYGLSLINSFVQNQKAHSITPPWVLKQYPEVAHVIYQLRNIPCLSGCVYCDKDLDIYIGLKKHFGFDSYRSFDGKPLQEQAVKAAVHNKSILAVFPTGGGKSITFQVPALMSGSTSRGLTVVISPLQSLMKDQIDNLEKAGITEAVTINGLLDPIERAQSIERVKNGSATMLYISPESLRSRTVENLLLGRKIIRFVIDEAHCFSAWGQDFRVDYLYIGDFIKMIQEKKNLEMGIPVSCFTATAKQNVITDICAYFQTTLGLELDVYAASATRTNLSYKIFPKADEEEKYQAARNLIEAKDCPTIIYVSRTTKAFNLAKRLSDDGFSAKPYHGKMDKKEKSENQNAFVAGDVSIMVATSAFGMGVDKKDVGMVIHYEISDSLENYIQEAGRAGRDENITADCFVLFNEEDLSKHFILLNQTKITIKEIQQIWRAIKRIHRQQNKLSNSALEIARQAGWDENVNEIETRVTSAIAALEDAGYLKRGQNDPEVYASSILAKNTQEAILRIDQSDRFNQKQKEQAVRIIKKLIASKSRSQSELDVAESRVDYISDHLGIVKGEVIQIIYLLREEEILAKTKDLTAYVNRSESVNRSLKTLETYIAIEKFLLPHLTEEEQTLHLKELNELAQESGCEGVNPAKIKTVLNFWSIKNWIKRKRVAYSKHHMAVISLLPPEDLKKRLEKRQVLAQFILDFLNQRSAHVQTKPSKTGEVLVEFSVHELKEAFQNSLTSFGEEAAIADVEDALFYLSRIDTIKIEGGFLVTYNRLTIERLEMDNLKRYTKDDYKRLAQFYESKIQQIHIVGEYAKKMIHNYSEALEFVDDYFQLNYTSFLRKYFPGSKMDELRLKMTPGKFKKLFGELSTTQLQIIKDNESKYIAVAAGPGSGKTRVLVHKLASLLLMEDVKHEQLLMVTFSRAAATEFKKRLLKLIGNAANFVEIKTFHSYCFDLLGKVGSIEKSTDIIRETTARIKSRDVDTSGITKTVMVIDEAQDMDRDEFNLIKALMEENEDMRVIAVGDDDQNIYEFRGASAQHLESFIRDYPTQKHELVENYRSKSNLVHFTNQFVQGIAHRLKETPIQPVAKDNGRIRIVKYTHPHLIVPLVKEITRAGLRGSTCVLTATNYEALQVTGLLLKNGVRARLIQTNDGFSLHNLVEIRYFLGEFTHHQGVYTIDTETWEEAKRELSKRFAKSTNLDLCQNIIADFEATNPKTKYISDLDVFLRESKLEDFFTSHGETIFVSTIHKAKGKEFDNIFILLEGFKADSDRAKRQLYVAMTRAKTNLTIHTNSNFLDAITAENTERVYDSTAYEPPKVVAMHLSYNDVWLDFFIKRQYLISKLIPGEELFVHENRCRNAQGQDVLVFSKHVLTRIEEMKQKGYVLKRVTGNFIVYWRKEGSEVETKVVLPEVWFEEVKTAERN